MGSAEQDDEEPQPWGYLENAESHLLNEFLSMVSERDWKNARVRQIDLLLGLFVERVILCLDYFLYLFPPPQYYNFHVF